MLAGWFAVLTGQTADAQRWAAYLDTASFDQIPVDGTASFTSARAMLRALMCATGPQQMATDARTAAAAEPPWSPWHAVAMCLSAEAQLLLGDPQRATPLLAQTSAVAAKLGNVGTVVLSHAELAVLAMDDGRWTQAAEHVNAALTAADQYRLHDYSLSVLAFAAAARLAVHHGNRKEVDRQLARAMRARPQCTFTLPWLAIRVRLQLAKVYAALTDHGTARHLLHEIDDILLHRPALGTLLDEVSTLREILTTGGPTTIGAGPPLTPAELRLLPYIQTHLTFREIGERLFVSRNTVSSQVGSIYRKLGVSSRSDAVQQATTIGLLGG